VLNEFLKEHKKVDEQQATISEITATVGKQESTISQLKSTMAQQRKDFQATTAHQQEQIEALAVNLQKVSAQLQLNKPGPQRVADN
jgi:IS30 family transposase